MIQSLYFSSESHTHLQAAGSKVKQNQLIQKQSSAVKVSQTGSLRSQPGRGGGVSSQSV